MKDKEKGALVDFERIWDCLIAIEKIQDEHLDSYNDVIFCLISKAKEITENGIKDLKTGKNKK